MGIIFIFFTAWRILDLIVAYIAKIFDKYHENFPYRFQLYHQNPFIPQFLIQFANYDGAHYLHIAHEGYHLYEQAFFPLFPLLIYLLAPLFDGGYFLAGIFLANVSFFVGLYFFKRYLESIAKHQITIIWIILFLLSFPTSFFFGSVYTEGLFFLLVLGSFYFTQKQQYWIAAIFSFFAALTRFMGVFLVIPLFATIVLEQHNFHILGNTYAEKVKYMLHFVYKKQKFFILILSPVFGLFCYMLYLYQTVHNPFYFYQALKGFHTGRSTHHIILLPQVYYRYFSMFLKAQHNFTYFVAVVEFITFNLIFWVLVYDVCVLLKGKNIPYRISLIGLNIFSFVNLLLPTFTGTLTSLPRYALFSLSFFIRIAEIKNLFIRISLLVIFIFFHVLLLAYFIQGHFIS